MAANDGIKLARMVGLTEAVQIDDVWTGKTDAAARRKRQNRLNQRAWKKRKVLQAEAEVASSEARDTLIVPSSDHRIRVPLILRQYGKVEFAFRTQATGRTKPIMPYAASDQAAVIFPLPLDHLLTLVQFNVLRAIVTNMAIVSVVQTVPMECRAVLDVPPLVIPDYTNMPVAFAPTALQLRTPHEPWMDMIPCGQFRDNIIIAVQNNNFAEDDWHMDVVGGLWEGFCDVEMRGLVAWSDPWSPRGWEVTEGFAKKWGYLLKGCIEMMDATNYWRAIRGEEDLVWEL